MEIEMIYSLRKASFLVECISGAVYLWEDDPYSEDWEHIYREVIEGFFYPAQDSKNGYFRGDDIYFQGIHAEDGRWIQVIDGVPVEPWIGETETLETLRRTWDQTMGMMDTYIQEGKPSESPFGSDDTYMIMQFASAFHGAYLVRRKNHFFLLSMNENIPKELHVILKGKNELLFGSLLKF
ncbi:hypothetical protein [Brevibacillus reuszeri]|uniref:hypothetical protein n=1 Tax=Brevibacillus reuszeri TaxID=54915 RepID=UPI000CCC7A1E|nr:hypothetical protein [Brevibacillus reuszeri]